MKNLRKWLDGKKTHLSTIAAVVSALAAFAAGEISALELALVIFGGASVSSLRAGVAKGPSK